MKHVFNSFYLDSPLVRGRIFDVFEPQEITQDTAVFIVHGGGWRAGSRDGFHEIMEALNERGYIAASTDYRLSGVNAFDQIEDIRTAYDRFVTLLKQKNRPLEIAVFGTSAGAHLASLLICAAPGECGEKNSLENEWVRPAFGLLQATPASFLPWEDIFPQIWDSMQNIAGASYKEDPERYRRLSLESYIHKGNPPLFFLEAENEHMFPPSMTLELVKKHHALGIPSRWKVYKNMEHGFIYALFRRQQREAFEDILLFIHGKLPDGTL